VHDDREPVDTECGDELFKLIDAIDRFPFLSGSAIRETTPKKIRRNQTKRSAKLTDKISVKVAPRRIAVETKNNGAATLINIVHLMAGNGHKARLKWQHLN
jgi:hypothetical protein